MIVPVSGGVSSGPARVVTGGDWESAIFAQNARMHAGEDGEDDIRRHAEAWIEENRAKFDGWLDEARKAAKK